MKRSLWLPALFVSSLPLLTLPAVLPAALADPAPAPATGPAAPAGVAAIVNGDKIMAADVERGVQALQQRNADAGLPTQTDPAQLAAMRKTVLDVLITSRLISQEAARTMVKAGYGRIIMISSINQQKAIRNQSHYCASKGGIMQLAKTMAIELARTGVTVNIIAPAAALTDFNRHIMADEAVRRRFETEIPAGRLAMPEDFTGAAAYLASEEAGYVTGAGLNIDGGFAA